MSDNGTQTRWRLTPLDESGLVYLGLDLTNGKQAALFIQTFNAAVSGAKPDDENLRDVLFAIMLRDCEIIEVEDREYFILPWDKDFDRSLAVLIDRLIHMRMSNAQSVALRLQLEMPL